MKFTAISKNGKEYLGRAANELFEFDSLLDAGWIRVTDIGQENLYFEFTDDAGITREGYCKCL